MDLFVHPITNRGSQSWLPSGGELGPPAARNSEFLMESPDFSRRFASAGVLLDGDFCGVIIP